MDRPSQEEVLQDIKPLTIEMQETFDSRAAQVSEFLDEHAPLAADGYSRSMLTRLLVKQTLMELGYDLGNVANTGLEITYLGKYRIKVVRSDHRGNPPRPQTLSRAAWCYPGQLRLTADGIDPELFWGIKRLGLRGSDVDGAILRAIGAQNDGLVHLLVDWRELRDEGRVEMAVSLPVGPWGIREVPRVAWRSVLVSDDDGLNEFVPSEEDIDIFPDEQDGEDGIGVAVG